MNSSAEVWLSVGVGLFSPSCSPYFPTRGILRGPLAVKPVVGSIKLSPFKICRVATAVSVVKRRDLQLCARVRNGRAVVVTVLYSRSPIMSCWDATSNA